MKKNIVIFRWAKNNEDDPRGDVQFNVPQTPGTKGMSFWRSNIKALWPYLSHFHCLLKWKKCSQYPMQKWKLGAKQDIVSYLLISIHFLANFNCYIISINGLKIRDGLWERTSRISKILLNAYNYWSQKFIWGTYSYFIRWISCIYILTTWKN